MCEVLEKFDPYAMAAPKTPQDVVALLNEAIDELYFFSRLWDDAMNPEKRPPSRYGV